MYEVQVLLIPQLLIAYLKSAFDRIIISSLKIKCHCCGWIVMDGLKYIKNI
jgi:hypothetical protein